MAAKTEPKKNLSALKRVKQSEKMALRNQSVKTKIKTQIGKLTSSLHDKNKEEVTAIFKETVKIISSAASKNVIHKNTASRKISRIAKKINALKDKEPVSEPSSQAEVS